MTRWILVLGLMLSVSAQAEQFHFVAIGDTAYNPNRDYPLYERLIGEINKSNPAFTVHVRTWRCWIR